jgi:hypothetical protein
MTVVWNLNLFLLFLHSATKSAQRVKKLHPHADPLSGILSIYWQAYDATFGGIYENYMDSLTYALSNLSLISLHKDSNLMPLMEASFVASLKW